MWNQIWPVAETVLLPVFQVASLQTGFSGYWESLFPEHIISFPDDTLYTSIALGPCQKLLAYMSKLDLWIPFC